jgi:hypothetical protein
MVLVWPAGLKLSLVLVLAPSTLLLFFHLAGGLQAEPKIRMLGLTPSACFAELQAVPQLALPESSISMRRMESPTFPFTWLAGGWLESSV